MKKLALTLVISCLSLSLSACNGIGALQGRFKGEEYKGLILPLSMPLPITENDYVRVDTTFSVYNSYRKSPSSNSHPAATIMSHNVGAEYHRILFKHDSISLDVYGGLGYSGSDYNEGHVRETGNGMAYKAGISVGVLGAGMIDFGYKAFPVGAGNVEAFGIFLTVP